MNDMNRQIAQLQERIARVTGRVDFLRGVSAVANERGCDGIPTSALCKLADLAREEYAAPEYAESLLKYVREHRTH